MPDSVVLSSFPRELQDAYPHADLLWALLETAHTGLALYSPIRGREGQITDFRIDLFNPAAQRMLGQPAQPTDTYLHYFPHTLDTGVFAFHCAAFEVGEPTTMAVNYQADDLDNYFHLTARRVGQGLLVSFTDTADQSRSPVELALREAQKAERAARADAEARRQQLHDVLHQAPVAIALLEGPHYQISLANPTVCELWDRPLPYLLGKPLLDALPELQGQGVDTLLDKVLYSGEPFIGTELPFQVMRHGQRETIYFNFVYQPQRDAQGNISGVLVVATDVTFTVLARQRVEVQEQETAALNEEIRANNEQLHITQSNLLLLNQELEVRVQQRTHEANAARAEAEAQRNRLERLFQQAPAAICILSGPELVFELINPSYQQFLPSRPLLGKPFLEALPELAGHAAYYTMRQVYETGETLWQSAMHAPLARTTDGALEDLYFNYVQQPRYDEHGRIDGVLVFGFEVTEQVLARQDREVRQTFLLQLTDALRPLTDPLEVQATAARLLGEHLGVDRSYYIAIDEIAQQFVVAQDWHRQHAPSHERRYPLSDWDMPWLLDGRTWVCRDVDTDPTLPDEQRPAYRGNHIRAAVVVPLLKQGRLAATFVINQNAPRAWTAQEVTLVEEVAQRIWIPVERAVVQEALRASEAKLAAMFDALPVGVGVFDSQGALLLANEQMQQYLPAGIMPSRDDSRHARWRAYHPDGRLLERTEFPGARALRGERVVPGTEMFYRRDDDTETWTQVVAVPLLDSTDQVSGHVTVILDIDELKRTEEALRESQQQLKEYNAQLQRTNVDLDNFIYTASHDLKAPISNIEGLLLALDAELPPAGRVGEVPHMLTLMQRAVERFKRTITHLTDLTKLQKEHNPASQQVGVAALIEEVRLDLAPLFRDTQARLEVDVRACTTICFSEKNLRSIVYNLLSNAVKYHHPDRSPEVHLRCRVQEGYQVLEVQDNGLGLDLSGGQQRLFTMFQRFHTHVEGSGMGLYMVKRIVENAGGHLEVESQPGEGSIFSVYLPQ